MNWPEVGRKRWRGRWWLCHIFGTDREFDLTSADRDTLIAIIVRQQAIIESLKERIAQLEGRVKSGGSERMSGLKPKAAEKPAQPKKPRQPRHHGFARTRMTPTQRVEHMVGQCPDCGTQLSGGWTQRTREVIDLPQGPVEVTSTLTSYAPAHRANGVVYLRRLPRAW